MSAILLHIKRFGSYLSMRNAVLFPLAGVSILTHLIIPARCFGPESSRMISLKRAFSITTYIPATVVEPARGSVRFWPVDSSR
jgi:hypothetical protein